LYTLNKNFNIALYYLRYAIERYPCCGYWGSSPCEFMWL